MTGKQFISAALLVTSAITSVVWSLWPSATDTVQADAQTTRLPSVPMSTAYEQIPAPQAAAPASQTASIPASTTTSNFTGTDQTIDPQYLHVQGLSEGENYGITQRVNALPINPSDYLDPALIQQLTQFIQAHRDENYFCLGSLIYRPSRNDGSLGNGELCSAVIENLAKALRLWIYDNANKEHRGADIDTTADLSIQAISHKDNNDRHFTRATCFYQRTGRGARTWCTPTPTP